LVGLVDLELLELQEISPFLFKPGSPGNVFQGYGLLFYCYKSEKKGVFLYYSSSDLPFSLFPAQIVEGRALPWM